MAPALGRIFGFDMFAHEDVDFHESLMLPILFENLHVVSQELHVSLVLLRFPVFLF
jgi:hypothetical protein